MQQRSCQVQLVSVRLSLAEPATLCRCAGFGMPSSAAHGRRRYARLAEGARIRAICGEAPDLSWGTPGTGLRALSRHFALSKRSKPQRILTPSSTHSSLVGKLDAELEKTQDLQSLRVDPIPHVRHT